MGYLKWAVESFQLCAGGVADGTQIHTHMCYSEFNKYETTAPTPVFYHHNDVHRIMKVDL